MPKYTFDTSFIVANKLSVYPDNFLFSEIVLLELIGSASDDSTFKKHQNTRRIFKEDEKLIIANSDDWLMASKILYWLEQGARKGNKGKSAPKKIGATQRMALDALIAVSARRYKATVVTENWDDFNTIKYYCNFKLLSGAEFLDKFK